MRKMGVGFLLALMACSASGGSLRDREQEITERSAEKIEKKKAAKSRSSSHAASPLFGSGLYPASRGESSFLGGFWGWLVAAPLHYRHDDPAAAMSAEGADGTTRPQFIFPEHKAGQATVPTVRFDFNYQFIDDAPTKDVFDGRLELGYKQFAFHHRSTRYVEDDGFKLDLSQYYAVLRYGGYRPDFVPGTFEFGIGVGAVHHAGDAADTSVAGTIPLKYCPTDWIGIEFRPAWYRWQEIAIGDYDLSVGIGARFVQLRGGYRWIWDDGIVDGQSGPYVGFSASF